MGWDWVSQSASHLGTPPVVPPIMSAQSQLASSSSRPQEEAILEWERNGQTKFQKRDGVGPPVPRIERTAARSSPNRLWPTLKFQLYCKDFGFSELIVWFFFESNCSGFFVRFELTCGCERWGFQGWGPEGWGPKPRKSGAPKGGAPKGGAPKGGGPKISRFFFPLPPQNSFFSPLSGLFAGNFEWCLKRRCVQMCAFGVLWLSCASPDGPVW